MMRIFIGIVSTMSCFVTFLCFRVTAAIVVAVKFIILASGVEYPVDICITGVVSGVFHWWFTGGGIVSDLGGITTTRACKDTGVVGREH